MLLLANIFSTGFSCAHSVKRVLDENDERDDWTQKEGVAVVYGCGPVSTAYTLELKRQVGLCAISSARTMFTRVYATYRNPERRVLPRRHGAIPLLAYEV